MEHTDKSEGRQKIIKHGTPIYGDEGHIKEIHGKVKVGSTVTWLGRRSRPHANDGRFMPGQTYPVCQIHSNSGDVELQGPNPQVTIRAGATEYW